MKGQIGKPKSKFLKVLCTKCKNEQIIFNKSASKVKCLVCGATGKRWLNSWKANRSGRQHLNNKHNRLGKIVIIGEQWY